MRPSVSEPKHPKCETCATTVHVHPWGTLQPNNHWTYNWRCGPCQYLHEHPDAALQPRTPRVPQRESLLDALL